MHDPTTDDKHDRYLVPGLARGLHLLRQFNRHEPVLTAPELVRRLGLPRSTVFRLIATLEGMGFLAKADDGYRLGMAVLGLGFEYLASLELAELGTPILQRLSGVTHGACNLVVRDGSFIIYVAKVSAPMPFPSAVNLGARLPAHATVLGRIMLSDLDDGELAQLYPDDHLPASTPRSPTTLDALRLLIRADGQRGYATGSGFFESGITSIAAPVRDRSGRVVAALGAALPALDLGDQRGAEIIGHVRDAALALSQLLDAPPSPI